MCGICGQYNFGTDAPVQRRDIERMAFSIAHRGPDDEGYFIRGSLGLGFRRLSIIDLAGGHQPMSDAQESVWVVFNGEIYNFPHLKQELESYGHVFRTKSDTEVIVHGYKQWGDDVLNHLNGMFGLAIWDAAQKKLLLARDPFGIKLVYYRISEGSLYFGSEIRPVMAAAGKRPDVDTTSVNLFLRYRYTPSPRTIFKGIHKLAPGTMLVCQNGQATVRRWYQYRPTHFSPPKSTAEATDDLLELYKQAMKRHLLSDVPVGLLLSGGVDSGLLLGLMNLYGDAWRTYTVGYGNSFADDELSDGARTASHFHSVHTAVTLDRPQFEAALQGIVSTLEEPIASSSIVPMYFVSQRARQDVKVALIGQGPDELFAGYRRHIGVRYGRYWAAMPAALRGPISTLVSSLPRNETLKRGIYALDTEDRLRRYQQVLSLLPAQQVNSLFRQELLEPHAGDKILDSWTDMVPLMDGTDELGGFQFLELRSTLPDELLMFGDKLSMAHGLEVRVPFLDRDIVEYVERLPESFKIRYSSQKWLHRQVCQKFLPREILRRKKRGFAVNVVDDWFGNAIEGTMTETLMDDSALMYDYLSPDNVRQLLAEHQSGRDDHHKILFSLMVFETWLRIQSSSGQEAQPFEFSAQR